MLQVLDLQGGIAETTDGYHWKLYVADESIISHTGLSEVRYGTWNPRDGSSRAKVRGTAPSDLIEETGARLIEALEECAHLVPFQPADVYECWLLDEQRQPLALLESATKKPIIGSEYSPHWYPGAAAKREFESLYGDAESLTEMIRQEAGRHPQGLWVERVATGSGITTGEDHYAANAFPELFIRLDWPDEAQSALVRDFLAWQAPWLLQLHHIDLTTREQLEQAAWQRPTETSRLFHLFPLILDQRSLTTTRVKSRILNGSEVPAPPEPFYPFYNE